MKRGRPQGISARQLSLFTYQFMLPEPGVTVSAPHPGQKKVLLGPSGPSSTRMPQLGLPIPFLIALFNDIICHIPIPLIVII
jgi:hypothetical protein